MSPAIDPPPLFAAAADEDQQHGSRCAEQHAARLERGDRFAQKEHRQDHREDGYRGGDDRNIDWRGEGESPEEKNLVELDAEERGDEQSAQVAPGDPFARQEGGCQPEEQKSPDQTIDRQGEMVEPLRVLGREKDGLADRGVQSPDDIGQQQGSVPFESSALHSIDSFFGDRDKDTQKTGTWCENCPMLSVYGSVAL